VKKILLLPFCLSKEEHAAAAGLAAEYGYSVIVSRSTAGALGEVRLRVAPGSADAVRIVGVVCFGRAKKVWVGLMALKARQFAKKALGMRTRRIELAHVPIVGGTKSLFGRRDCNIGFNVLDTAALREALSGDRTFVRI
jgi:hypothetical protein